MALAPDSVHVVIVNWNGAEDLRRCLRALEACDPPCGPVHVVDNGSDDASRDLLAEPWELPLRVRLEDRNHGFARAVNLAVRDALEEGAAAVCLMNNDATCEPGFFGALAAGVERDPRAGLYGPRIFSDRAAGRLWCCGVSMGGPNLCRLRGHGERDAERWRREERVESLTGCGLLVLRAVFERTGMLDERYFVYVEDADFCARAIKAGFACRYLPEAVLEHAGAGSSGGGYSALRKYLSAHGAVRYLREHGTRGLWAGWIVFDLLPLPLLWGIALLRGRERGVRAKALGLLHGLLRREPDLARLGLRR